MRERDMLRHSLNASVILTRKSFSYWHCCALESADIAARIALISDGTAQANGFLPSGIFILIDWCDVLLVDTRDMVDLSVVLWAYP
jgi:hypothetical protein